MALAPRIRRIWKRVGFSRLLEESACQPSSVNCHRLYHDPVSEFIKVASLDDIPPGRVIGVKVGDEEVALYNVDGTIYATRDVCTHQYFPLSKGELRGRVVTCALHQWRYDVTTGANL